MDNIVTTLYILLLRLLTWRDYNNIIVDRYLYFYGCNILFLGNVFLGWIFLAKAEQQYLRQSSNKHKYKNKNNFTLLYLFNL